MNHLSLTCLLAGALACSSLSASAQITERERPAEWAQLVPGARFIDRFMPMQGQELSSDTWGAEYVKPRYVDNGIEDRIWSYWGGNILRDDEGKYHMMVCGWLENSPKGHMQWSKSFAFNAISDSLQGPYKIRDLIGDGHNPEAYRMDDGRYVLYVINGRYVAPSLNGPWEYGKFEFDTRDREIIEGLSNLSFARRADGSFLMVDRGGGIWVSEDGLKPYRLLTHEQAYPPVKGEFEDPVLWRDSVQYHLIVNDWLGRIAFYERSADGINWIVDPGEAYAPGIAVHSDGGKEDWFKYERLKVYQDEHGRVIQTNFAVIDTLKHEDKPYDIHSSKNITLPMNPGLLLSIEGSIPTKGCTIAVRIKGEPGFNPSADLDLGSLRFGSNQDVNFGAGGVLVDLSADGNDAIATFEFDPKRDWEEEFALKLIGRDVQGNMVFGFAANPASPRDSQILSARAPYIAADGQLWVKVENFGLKSSAPAQIVMCSPEGKQLAKASLPSLLPYQEEGVLLPAKKYAAGDSVTIKILQNGRQLSQFPTQIK